MSKRLNVTEPFLPPLAEMQEALAQIWSNKTLTNGGPFHKDFEAKLAEFLGVEHISLFCNATIALITALQTLRISGEVITTPYSFVATAHSLVWNNIKPVFVDIDPHTFNLDPDKVEQAITPNTSCVLAVHVYGNPCEHERLQKICDTYGLKLIYDAAHAFNVRKAGQPILLNGDLSILSFHATKVFHTFEGGAIIAPDRKTKERIDFLKNFGFSNETTVVAPGINGKMNEFQAALGLIQLQHFPESLERRRKVYERYLEQLEGLDGIQPFQPASDLEWNYSYFPILVSPDLGISRDALYFALRDSNIYARRYFYPLISTFPMYRGLPSANETHLTKAHLVSNSVICLPLSANMEPEDAERVIDALRLAISTKSNYLPAK